MLEKAINDLTVVMLELVNELRATRGAPTGMQDAKLEVEQTKPRTVKPEDNAQTQAKGEAKVEAKADAKATKPVTDEPAPAIEYATVQTAFKQATAKHGEKARDKALELLARHGCKKLPDLLPAQYAKFLADCEAL